MPSRPCCAEGGGLIQAPARRKETSVISENAQNAVAGARGVLAEIRVHTEVMRSAARARGTSLLPPLLMLGTSERVGSNWLSDTLRPVDGATQRAVPPAARRRSPSVRAQSAGGSGRRGYRHGLGTYGRHWLVTFVTSKYGTTRQGVKETNLFFALASLLALFPDSPVAVLSRSPLGVVSSFMRSGLFTRWDYRSRYRQMLTMTRSGRDRCYAVLVPDDDPPGIVALTRLQVLNTVLLAAALDGRDAVHIPYEAAVRSRDQVLAGLARVVPSWQAGSARPAGCRPACRLRLARLTRTRDLQHRRREGRAGRVPERGGSRGREGSRRCRARRRGQRGARPGSRAGSGLARRQPALPACAPPSGRNPGPGRATATTDADRPGYVRRGRAGVAEPPGHQRRVHRDAQRAGAGRAGQLARRDAPARLPDAARARRAAALRPGRRAVAGQRRATRCTPFTG